MYRAAANVPHIPTPNESLRSHRPAGCQCGLAFDWAVQQPPRSVDRRINADVAVGCRDGVTGRQSARGCGKTSRSSWLAYARRPRGSPIPLVDAFLR
jgi:hypothetical protein